MDDGLEEAATESVSLLRKEILERQKHQQGAGNKHRAKATAEPSTVPSVCWHFKYFTQQQLFPNYTCRLYIFFTHCKKHTKKEKPLVWATVLRSILDTAEK